MQGGEINNEYIDIAVYYRINTMSPLLRSVSIGTEGFLHFNYRLINCRTSALLAYKARAYTCMANRNSC